MHCYECADDRTKAFVRYASLRSTLGLTVHQWWMASLVVSWQDNSSLPWLIIGGFEAVDAFSWSAKDAPLPVTTQPPENILSPLVAAPIFCICHSIQQALYYWLCLYNIITTPARQPFLEVTKFTRPFGFPVAAEALHPLGKQVNFSVSSFSAVCAM